MNVDLRGSRDFALKLVGIERLSWDSRSERVACNDFLSKNNYSLIAHDQAKMVLLAITTGFILALEHRSILDEFSAPCVWHGCTAKFNLGEEFDWFSFPSRTFFCA